MNVSYARVTFLVACLSLAFVWPAGAVEIRHAVQPVKGRYLVIVSPFTADVPAVARELSKKYQGRILATWTHAAKGFWVELPEENAERLARDSRVMTMEEDAEVYSSGAGSRMTGPAGPGQAVPAITPPDGADLSVFPTDALWHLTRISHRENKPTSTDPESYYTYRWSNDGTGVTVYHIDTGVRANHIELQDRIRRELDGTYSGKNAAQLPYYSTVIPADYVKNDTSSPSAPCSGLDMSDVDDYSAHGTGTASLVVGKNLGVAGGALLVPVTVLSCDRTYGANLSSAAILLSGLDWVMQDFKAHSQRAVVTMSTFRFTDTTGGHRCDATSCDGKSSLDILETAINNLINLGVPVVASSNNQQADACTQTPGRLSRRGGLLDPSRSCPDPGCRTRVITVGATGFRDNRMMIDNSYDPTKGIGSNYGQCVDIWAPGQLVSVASGEGLDRYREAKVASGTSYAAPIVAGVIARLLAEDPSLSQNPIETADRVWERLAANATHLSPTRVAPPSVAELNDASVLGAGSPDLLVHLASVTFTSEPQSRRIPPGSSGTLSVAVLDQPVDYQTLQPGEPRFLYRWYRRDDTNSTPVTAVDQNCPTITVRDAPTTAPCEYQITGTTYLWARVLRNRTSDYGDSVPARVEVSSCSPPMITKQPASVWSPEQNPSDQARTLTATIQSSTPYCYQWQRITPQFLLPGVAEPGAEVFETVKSGSENGDATLAYSEGAAAANPRRPNYYRLVLWPSGGAPCSQPTTACMVISETAQIRNCTIPTADVFPYTERAIDPTVGNSDLKVSIGSSPITWLSCLETTCDNLTAFTPVRTTFNPSPSTSAERLEHDSRFVPRQKGYYRVRRESSCGMAISAAVNVTSVCDYQLSFQAPALGLSTIWHYPDEIQTAVSKVAPGTKIRLIVGPGSSTDGRSLSSARTGDRLPIYQWVGLRPGDTAVGDTANITITTDNHTITVNAIDPDPRTGCNKSFTFNFQTTECPATASFNLAGEHCIVYKSGEPYYTFVDGRVALNALPSDTTGSAVDPSGFVFTWILNGDHGGTETLSGPALDIAVNRPDGGHIQSITLTARGLLGQGCRTITIPVHLSYSSCPGCAPQCKRRAVRSGSGADLPAVITIDSGEQITLAPPEERSGWTYEWHRATATEVDEQFAVSAQVTVAPVTNTRFYVITTRSPAEVERSDDLQVLVRGAYDARAIPELQAIEAGSIATITASNEGLPFTFDSTTSFAWRRGPDRDPNQPALPGETHATLSVVSPADDLSFWCRITHNGHVYDTNVATVIVTCTPTISGSILTSPWSPYVGRGELAYLSAVGWGKLLSYRWTYRTSQNASAEDYSFGPAIRPLVNTPVTWFGVVAQDACGTTATFQEVPIYLCVAKVTEQPESTVIEPGRSAQLRVIARPAIDGQPLTFNWYRRSDNWAITSLGQGTAIAENGQPGSEFTTPPMASSDSFFATVTSICGGQDGGQGIEHRVFSSSADVEVCSYPVITSQSLTRDTTAGQATTVVVVVSGQDLTFQWYHGTTGDTSQPVPGGTDNSVTVAPSQTTSYWCRIKSRGVCTTDSPTSTVRVCMTPVINTQPQSRTVFAGATTTLSVVMATDTNTEPLKYQWQRLDAGGWGIIPGATSATYTTPALTDEAAYRVEITVGVCQVMSETATISMCLWPEIVTLSAPEKLIQYGASATLTLDAMSPVADRYVAWYRGASGDRTNLVAAAQNLSTYTTPALTATTTYWAELTNNGCASRTTTYTARVCKPTITTQPAGGTIESGLSTTLTVGTTPLPGQTLQWYVGTPGTTTSPIAGETSPSITVSPTATTTYWVRVTGTCNTSADSNAATVTVCTPPQFTSVSPPQFIAAGSSTLIGVATNAPSPSFKWYVGASGIKTNPVANSNSSSINVSPATTTTYWAEVTSAICVSNSPAIAVNVCAPPSFSIQPQPQAIFSGTAATLTAAASSPTGAVTYQWYAGAAGDTASPINGAVSATLTVTPATETSYWVRATTSVCTANSNAAVVSICLYPPVVDGNPVEKLIGYGESTSISLPPMSPVADKYVTWYRGASGDRTTALGGALNLSTYSTPALTATTQYWAEFTNGGCTSRTNTYTARVCKPAITTQPSGTTIPLGQSATLTTVTTAIAGQTFQWYTGTPGTTTSPVSGATSNALTISPSATTTYWLRVTGTCGISADSTAATVTVCNPPVITSTSPTRYIEAGTPASVSVTATGSNLTYQWYLGNSGVTTSPINGAVGAAYVASPSVTTTYWCRIMSAGVCPTTGPTLTIDVCNKPSITTQPVSSRIFSGKPTTLSVTATSPRPLTYQWYTGIAGDMSSPINGATSTSVIVAPTTDTNYWVRVTTSVCFIDSATATLSMCSYPEVITPSPAQINLASGQSTTLTMPPLSPVDNKTVTWYRGASGDKSQLLASALNLNSYTTPALTATTLYWAEFTNNTCVSRTTTWTVAVCKPTITVQPQSTTVPSGGQTTLSVTATGAPLTYQWYVGSSGNTASPISGATNGSYTTPALTSNTTYWVRVTGCTTADSASATVSICTAPTVTNLTKTATHTPGGTGSVTVTATGTGLTYQWYKGQSGDTSHIISGATSSTYTFGLQTSEYYWARVTASCNGSTANSTAIMYSVDPAITAQPQSITIPSGTTTTLSVQANGTYLSYKWYSTSSPTAIAGATSASYTTPALTTETAYYCTITSGTTAVAYSNYATVSICTGPFIGSITRQFVGGTLWVVTVSVGSPDNQNVKYLWYRGVPGNVAQSTFLGEGGTQFTVATPAQSTTYWARVQWLDDTCYSDSTGATIP